MFSKISLGLILVLYSSLVFSDYEDAERFYGKSSAGITGYRKTIVELVNEGHYFSVVPWIKDYVFKSDGNLDREIENAIDRVVEYTGVRVFDTLPDSILKKSSSSAIRFILAKRMLRNEKHLEAISELNRISPTQISYPFVLNLRASIHSSIGQFQSAIIDFNDCVEISDERISDTKNPILKDQLRVNREYCFAGIARAKFGQKDFKEADLLYLDIPKDSFIWPQILFEEAWNSYYLKNYNRTLGKLVSYNAPVFDFIFNPEIDVLRALTYLKLCLYEDAKKTVDEFYLENERHAKNLKSFLSERGRDPRYFYQLIADHEAGKPMPLPIIENLIYSIRKDPAVISIKNSLAGAIYEYKKIKNKRSSNLKTNLLRNLQILADEYKSTLGAFVRSSLVKKLNQFNSAFQGMSYIKLEVLAQRKDRLYSDEGNSPKKRGDVKYLERNDKQYFWTFNGEFWADELGDYVFALRSECGD